VCNAASSTCDTLRHTTPRKHTHIRQSQIPSRLVRIFDPFIRTHARARAHTHTHTHTRYYPTIAPLCIVAAGLPYTFGSEKPRVIPSRLHGIYYNHFRIKFTRQILYRREFRIYIYNMKTIYGYPVVKITKRFLTKRLLLFCLLSKQR